MSSLISQLSILNRLVNQQPYKGYQEKSFFLLIEVLILRGDFLELKNSKCQNNPSIQGTCHLGCTQIHRIRLRDPLLNSDLSPPKGLGTRG